MMIQTRILNFLTKSRGTGSLASFRCGASMMEALMAESKENETAHREVGYRHWMAQAIGVGSDRWIAWVAE